MKRRLAGFAVALSLVAAAPVANVTADATRPTAVAAKSCSSGFTHAALPWGHKCLRRGQFCKASGDRSYHRYGYHCHGGRLK